ncbi:MAG: hypothetical protein R3358_04910 [Woeseiaceae bacterium]|nr:hypothetical protein [Woeseiaceae bacterium]
MWLPTPVYERVPQYWFLLGVGFFAFGLYLGFDYPYVRGYFAVGAGCIICSIWVTYARHRNRARRAREAEFKADIAAADADSSETTDTSS